MFPKTHLDYRVIVATFSKKNQIIVNFIKVSGSCRKASLFAANVVPGVSKFDSSP